MFAISLQPFGTWQTTNKNVVKAGIDAVKNVLDAGYVPVLHGDCTLDLEQHCCILSGDTVIEVRYGNDLTYKFTRILTRKLSSTL